MASSKGRASILGERTNDNGLVNKQDRRRLMSMGSMMDSDEEENNNNNTENHSLQQPKRRASSAHVPVRNSKTSTKDTSTDKDNSSGQPQNNENNPNASSRSNFNHDMSQSMMRQNRRLLATSQVAASILTPHNAAAQVLTEPPAWAGFVQKSNKVKSFLDEALHHVATGYAITNAAGSKRQRVTNENDQNLLPQHEMEREQATALVAKEKSKEVLILQQKLEEAQKQVTALTASNQALREESTASTLRFERTVEALKIAAASAASARTDADQAELSAECLATQLEALQTVVEQTKQAAQVLHEEQQEITEQAKSGQAKLLKVEAELARSQKEATQLKEKVKNWESKAKELQEESSTLKRQLADETEKTRKLTKTLEERDVLEEARKKRIQQVEKELQEAQAMLVDASSAAVDTSTLESLNEIIEKLEEGNKSLHEQLTEQEETANQDKERLRQSLLIAEQEAQTLRIEASLNGDKEATTTPTSATGGDVDTSFTISTNLNTMPTPQSSVGKDKHAVPPSATCSICFKAAFGLMKSCQCGRPACDKRAHLTCVNQINPGPSVSHPGTPAAKLPVVLCNGALAGIMNRSENESTE